MKSDMINDNSLPTEKPKEDTQIKALFLKNGQLQAKQPCTNICQIMTPVICLIFTYLIKQLASQNLPAASLFADNAYPYLFNNYTLLDTYSKTKNQTDARKNKLEWYLFSCQDPACNSTAIGNYSGDSLIRDNKTILGAIPSDPNIRVVYTDDYYTNPNQNVSKYVPFFKETNNSNAELYQRLTKIQSNTFQDISNGTNGLDYLPDGAITFQAISNTTIRAKLQVNDVRDLDLHRNNGVTNLKESRKLVSGGYAQSTDIISAYGLLNLQHMISASYTQYLTNQKVQGGYVFMRDTKSSSDIVNSLINTVSALIFPLSLSLLFPVMLYGLVLQKQQKLVQMMKMNGMRISSYWLVYFIFNFLLCLVTNLVFFLLGAFALKSDFFTKTSPVLLAIIAVGWSLSQIGLAAFFQTFLSKARSANIIGYVIAIWLMMIASTLNIGVYQVPTQFPGWLQAFAPFSFNRLFYLMLIDCSDADCYNTLDEISAEMKNCIVALYMGFIVFFSLGAYLLQVLPQQFGVSKHPLFPFIEFYKFITCKIKTTYSHPEKDVQLRRYLGEDEQDPLSKAERHDVSNILEINSSTPLVINNLRKLYTKQGYKGPFAAVNSFNLKVQNKETFGLLGPNGAGKTTLISMLTGMITPNYGNAWIGGFDIQTNVSRAQLQMGVCPQFDLLWPQLTVEEHLRFYARLKGTPGNELKNRVEQAIQEVHLTEFKNFLASSLSGGMKRRLSIAISLVGDPKIVFLDQPSSGLDPDNRRQIWEVLTKCQQKRAVFLTTHMMQEADALCHRIGIITHGALRTVGNPLKLKKSYGQGYRLSLSLQAKQRHLVSPENLHLSEQNMNMEPEQQNQLTLRKSINDLVLQDHLGQHLRVQKGVRVVADYINNHFPGSVLVKIFGNSLIFKVPINYKLSTIFVQMHEAEKELKITNVSITNSSLQDVFFQVVKKYDQMEDESNSSQLHLQSIPPPLNKTDQYQEMKREEASPPSLPPPPPPFKKKRPGDSKYGSVLLKDRESVISDEELKKAKKQDDL